MSVSAEIGGLAYGVIPIEQYNEAVEKSGKTEEEFQAELTQRIYDTWGEMEKDNSIYFYDKQYNYVSLDDMEIEYVKEDDYISVDAKVEGTVCADYTLCTRPQREPDDPYSTIDRCPEECEVPQLAENVLKRVFDDMGFTDYDIDTDDYDTVDWEELLYEEEESYDDYYEEY